MVTEGPGEIQAPPADLQFSLSEMSRSEAPGSYMGLLEQL